MAKWKVRYNETHSGINTTVVSHTNWPIAYGLIRAHECAQCGAEMWSGDKTIEIKQVDTRYPFHILLGVDYYCAKCANVWR